MTLFYLEDVKEKIKSEYFWLRENYPLPLFSEIKLKIFNPNAYNMIFGQDEPYKEKEIGGVVLDKLEEEILEFNIILILAKHWEIDEADEYTLNKYKVNPQHLPFWILYHEYGHIVDVHNVYKKRGLKGLEKYYENVEQEIIKLEQKMEKKKLNYKEVNERYKKLKTERKADEFAEERYKERIVKIIN
jgi:hypothetical protein